MTDSAGPGGFTSTDEVARELRDARGRMHDRAALVNLCQALRDLCRPESDGGGAAAVRLLVDDPMDHDPDMGPATAVAVTDVLHLVDQADPRTTVFFMVEEASDVVVGQFGRGKTDSSLARHITELLRTARKTGYRDRETPPSGHLDLIDVTREINNDPTLHDAVLHRDNPAQRPHVRDPHADENPGLSAIAAFALVALHRNRTPLTADELLARVQTRITGTAPLTRPEIVAALAELYATGAVTVMQVGDPCYLAAAHRPDPALEPALAVLVAEHLAQVGEAGADITDLVEHLASTYTFDDGRRPTSDRVAIAISAATARRLAVQPGSPRRYYTPEHAPF